jgi:hypothetical protein
MMKKPKPKREKKPGLTKVARRARKHREFVPPHSLAALRDALRDLLAYYDRVIADNGGAGPSWTAADVKRIEEIRNLCASK